MLLRLKGVVVSDEEKADSIRQVCDGKMSASESPLTHRKGLQTLSKRVEVADTRISMDVTCLRSTRQPVFRWHELNRFAEDWRLHRPRYGTWEPAMGVLNEVFRAAVGKVTSGHNQEGEY